MKRDSNEMANCRFCGEKLAADTQFDTRFCADEHRVQYHDKRNSVRLAFERAAQAILELEKIAKSEQLFSSDAAIYLGQLYSVVKPVEVSDGLHPSPMEQTSASLTGSA